MTTTATATATSLSVPRPVARPMAGASRFNAAPGAKRSRPMVGTFEENILNNRLEPIRTVDGYVADVRASSHLKQPNPMRSGVRVSFYSVDGCFPYLGQVNLGHRGYKIPKKGTLQVTLFNPNGTLVKLFLLHYDLTDMPPNSQTFLRQKTLFLPVRTATTTATTTTTTATATFPIKATANTDLAHSCNQHTSSSFQMTRAILSDKTSKKTQQQQQNHSAGQLSARSRIKYLIQLNIVSSKSGRIYLNKDLRIFISKKVDLETASQFTKQNYELRAFDEMPSDPKYFSR